MSRKRLANGLAVATRIDDKMRATFDQQGKLPRIGAGKTRELAAFYRKVLEFWKPISIANEVSVQVDDLRRKIEALPPTDEVCRKEYEASKEVERLSVECFLELAKTDRGRNHKR